MNRLPPVYVPCIIQHSRSSNTPIQVTKLSVKLPFVRLALICPDMSTLNDFEEHRTSRHCHYIRPESLSVDMFGVDIRNGGASDSHFLISAESLQVALQRGQGIISIVAFSLSPAFY